ncbi:MAG: hypothetical protein SFX72_13405 [Isosphaeraceae bacterium]|nr:hypothetical protein [Isosphaeraceae bacterium]
MIGPARRTWIALLIAWHATVAVCASSLHALPGLGHVEHHADCGSSDRIAPSLGDDCPLCDHLSQSHAFDPAPPGFAARAVEAAVLAPRDRIDLPAPPLGSPPRAPPA